MEPSINGNVHVEGNGARATVPPNLNSPKSNSPKSIKPARPSPKAAPATRGARTRTHEVGLRKLKSEAISELECQRDKLSLEYWKFTEEEAARRAHRRRGLLEKGIAALISDRAGNHSWNRVSGCADLVVERCEMLIRANKELDDSLREFADGSGFRLFDGLAPILRQTRHIEAAFPLIAYPPAREDLFELIGETTLLIQLLRQLKLVEENR